MTNEQARLQASAPKVFVYIIHKQNIERKFFRIPFSIKFIVISITDMKMEQCFFFK